MTTPKPPPMVVPKEMPPQASSEHLAKRDRLITELEKASKDATGTLQQVLRKMMSMLTGTKPGMPYNPQATQDVKDAFSRYVADKEQATTPPPAILLEAVDWMQTYLAQRGFPVNPPGGAAPAGPSATPAAPAPPAAKPAGPAAKGSKDGFDSSRSTHAQSIGGEAPVAPAQPGEKQQIDSMKETLKNWQLNSQLGKVKG